MISILCPSTHSYCWFRPFRLIEVEYHSGATPTSLVRTMLPSTVSSHTNSKCKSESEWTKRETLCSDMDGPWEWEPQVVTPVSTPVTTPSSTPSTPPPMPGGSKSSTKSKTSVGSRFHFSFKVSLVVELKEE